jgi:hypothetical protein
MIRAAAITFAAARLLAAWLSPSPATATWSTQLHVTGVVDVSAPRSDGRLVVSGGRRLWLLDPRSGELTPFATGAGGYMGGGGDEPYLALSTGRRVAAAGCAFAPDDVYIVQQSTRDVLRVDAAGRARRFAHVDGVDSLSGIAFDTTGRFGNRLLAIGPSRGGTVVVAIDCRAAATHETDRAPAMEGGIAVAPPSFGPYSGDLVGADELSGRVLAVRPDGSTAVVVRSGLPAGGDIGVEGVGFLPPGFAVGGTAYFADRSTPGNRHPGTDSLLRLDAPALVAAGAREGDLLVATEGGARTIAVECGPSRAGCWTWRRARRPRTARGTSSPWPIGRRAPRPTCPRRPTWARRHARRRG